MVSKKYNNDIKEYIKKLDEEELKHISVRLARRLGGDLGEAIESIQNHAEIDKWLATAESANDFFDMIDNVDNYVQQEVKKRVSYGKSTSRVW